MISHFFTAPFIFEPLYIQRNCFQKNEKYFKCTNNIFTARLLSDIIKSGLV